MRLIISTFATYLFLSDQIREGGTGWACSTDGVDGKYTQNFIGIS
jgi:hypothetical protein